jgi:hypothetical protein
MTGQPQSPATTPPWKSAVERRYSAFLEQLSAKGRATIVKHDEMAEADGNQGYGELWKRLAGWMGKLAPHATEMQGSQAVKFHIADGKYKQQVFALEHTKQGLVIVYLPDVLALAMERKILAPGSTPQTFKVLTLDHTQVHLDVIDAETRDMTVCKPMLGWGRRALRAELTALAKENEIAAIEQLCQLASEKWQNQPETPAKT